MAEETTVPQDHAVAIMFPPARGQADPEVYRDHFERLLWCRGESVVGRFHTQVLALPRFEGQNHMPDFALFTFSDPDSAFAFKMRWA